MPTSSRSTIGVAILALVALIDISWGVESWLGLIDSADHPPVPVLVLFALVGAVTLASAQPALRGNRIAAWIMVGSRLVSVPLADLPPVFLDAPGWVTAIALSAIILTALGIRLAAPLLRAAGAARTSTRTAA